MIPFPPPNPSPKKHSFNTLCSRQFHVSKRVLTINFINNINFSRTTQNEVSTYGFETPKKTACKHLWKCCVEHHAFFRLIRVSPVLPQAGTGDIFSLGSRFRYRFIKHLRINFVQNF